MGSAFTFPCIDNKHDITLIGSPLENDQIDNLNKDCFHKNLNCKLSDKIVFLNSILPTELLLSIDKESDQKSITTLFDSMFWVLT